MVSLACFSNPGSCLSPPHNKRRPHGAPERRYTTPDTMETLPQDILAHVLRFLPPPARPDTDRAPPLTTADWLFNLWDSGGRGAVAPPPPHGTPGAPGRAGLRELLAGPY